MPGAKEIRSKDREYQEHSEDHQGHADGGDEQDAPARRSACARRVRTRRRCAQSSATCARRIRDYRHPFLIERAVEGRGHSSSSAPIAACAAALECKSVQDGAGIDPRMAAEGCSTSACA